MLQVIPVIGGFAIIGGDVVSMPPSDYSPRWSERVSYTQQDGGTAVPRHPGEGVIFTGTESVTFRALSRATNPSEPARTAYEFDIAPGHPCDVNYSGTVDTQDLLAFLRQYRDWYDFNVDGVTDVQDLLAFLRMFRVRGEPGGSLDGGPVSTGAPGTSVPRDPASPVSV